jgi:hypothetical protein
MSIGNDGIGYFFILLLVLIAAPLVFWIGSVLYAWVKWLFNDKQKLNASYSEIKDISNPVRGTVKLTYMLGSAGRTKLVLVDNNFNEKNELFHEDKSIGKHSFEFESNRLENGAYFLEMTTINQKITKKLVIEN